MKALELRHVSEKYRVKFITEGRVSWEEILALRDITLSLNTGDVLGVIGQNGSGKTTLLRLIAGMLVADEGEIVVNGRVSALMELGAGFNPEFTGRENLIIAAGMYGLDRNFLEKRIQEIMDFSGLEKFIDAPIKYYSQGMFMRLAFSLAIFVDPDVLLIDDILSVGDEEAQRKCIKKVFELKQAGKTIVVVSHDLHMLAKLCDRAILLEKGKIIEDGSVQTVVARYLETLEDRTGIRALESQGILVVFNKGRVNLSYKGCPITNEQGIFASFLDPLTKKRVISSDISWNISASSDDEIIAQGVDSRGLNQVWHIRLKDNSLDFHIELKEQQNKNQLVEFYAVALYTMWLTAESENTFPAFAHKTNWQDLGLEKTSDRIVGFIPEANDNCASPGFVFRGKSDTLELKIFNSGYQQEARIIQADASGSNSISFELNIYDATDKLRAYFGELKNKYLMKKAQERELFIAARTITAGDLRLFVDDENRSIRLYSNDKELTQANGFQSEFVVKSKRLQITDGVWEVRKTSGFCLSLSVLYADFKLTQTIKFSFNDGNALDVKTSLVASNEVDVGNYRFILSLADNYQQWQTENEKGEFATEKYVNNILPIRLKENKLSCLTLLAQNSNEFPKLSYIIDNNEGNQIVGLYKEKESQDKAAINISCAFIVARNAQKIGIDQREYFRGSILMGAQSVLPVKRQPKQNVVLSVDSLRFIFDEGRGRIFWDGKEVTCGLSLFTSMRSSNIWHDSYQAVWKVKKTDSDRLVVHGDWPYIPVSQTWDIKLQNKNVISLKIDMEIYANANASIEIEQTNIMLSSSFDQWIVPNEARGEFSKEFSSQYDIMPFRFWCGKPPENLITAAGKEVAQVSFANSGNDDQTWAVIENSDRLYKAHLLQYQRAPQQATTPLQYRYFEGEVRIEP